jgi:hypothetical protein
VEEVRKGLPLGAEQLRSYFAKPEREDAARAREALDRARNKVQDLRVAKSTFFALLDERGVALRNDRDQDSMAGKSLLPAFPFLKQALEGRYIEGRGKLPEATGLRDQVDGQWVAAQPVSEGGKTVGLYITGWSWSAYAYRLENQIRSQIRSGLKDQEREPLVYVYLVVGDEVFGAPVSPTVNAKAIRDIGFLRNPAAKQGPIALEREVTGRAFGVAFQLTPQLGEGVGVVVMRSET